MLRVGCNGSLVKKLMERGVPPASTTPQIFLWLRFLNQILKPITFPRVLSISLGANGHVPHTSLTQLGVIMKLGKKKDHPDHLLNLEPLKWSIRSWRTKIVKHSQWNMILLDCYFKALAMPERNWGCTVRLGEKSKVEKKDLHSWKWIGNLILKLVCFLQLFYLSTPSVVHLHLKKKLVLMGKWGKKMQNWQNGQKSLFEGRKRFPRCIIGGFEGGLDL